MNGEAVTSQQKSSVKPAAAGASTSEVKAKRRTKVRNASITAGFVHLALLGVISWGNSEGPERAWWSTLNLYVPQLLWALPAFILLPFVAVVARKWIWLPLIALLWVAVPLMGFHWNSPDTRLFDTRPRLRVMTYNVGGQPNHMLVADEIEKAHPDVLFLQEALSQPSFLNEDWYVAGPFGGSLIAARMPLTDVEDRVLRNAPDWRRYVRCKIEVSSIPITLYGLHLDTPREALASLRERKLAGIEGIENDAMTRLFRAAGVAESLRRESGSVIVAGDLNVPEQSMICRTLERTGLRDAFAEGGRGYGYTYGHDTRVGISYVRIDHILVGKSLKVGTCLTGGSDGSDHRPVIADLYIVK